MDTKIEKKLPWIKDLTWHRHPYYSLFAPMDWDYFQSPDDLDVIAEGFFGPSNGMHPTQKIPR